MLFSRTRPVRLALAPVAMLQLQEQEAGALVQVSSSRRALDRPSGGYGLTLPWLALSCQVGRGREDAVVEDEGGERIDAIDVLAPLS